MSILRSIQIRTENLIKGSLKEKLVFVHVPKCGGNSIAAAIHDRYKTFSPRGTPGLVNIDAAASLKATEILFGSDPFEDDYVNVLRIRELLLIYFLNMKETRMVSGHMPFSGLAYDKHKDDYAFVTILRDPVKRWISAFFYNKYREASKWKIGDDLTNYVESKRGRANGYEYVKKLFGSVAPGIDFTSDAAIDTAKQNLAKFDVLGVLEDTQGFKKKFKDRFDVELSIGQKNTGPKSSNYVKSFITKDMEERIREICRPDLAIYQHAIDNF